MSRLQPWAPVIQESSLYVLLFLLPFAPAAAEVMFGFLLLGWSMERLNPKTRTQSIWWQPANHGLLLAVGVYVVVCALSIVVSDYPTKSLLGFVKKWLQYLSLLIIGADLGSRFSVVKRGLIVLAASSFFVILEAVWQERFGRGLFRGYHLSIYDRITGPYQNPSDLATYLMVLIPIILSYACLSRGWHRGLVWFLLVALVVFLGKTQARGAFLGLCLGLIPLLLIQRRMRRSGVALLVMVFLAGAMFLQRSGGFVHVFSDTDTGTADRLVMWRAALRMIKDRPILGHGLNTFMANYLKYWVGGERMPRYAHNCYLQVAAETGVMGLVAFVTLLGMLFWRLIRRSFQHATDRSVILVGFTAGLLAFAIQAGVDTNFYSLRQAVLFWLLAGLALGVSELGAREGPRIS